MKISARTLAALFALIIVEILVCSSFCQCHIIIPRERLTIQSRKLLVSTASVSINPNKINGAMKEYPKKAVEPSFRQKPPSAPNPTQNR
ncbi:hypothetical protein CJ030_MR1G008461 [Morella rubra]|uniref:Uncharacterized protein n=1 Tax=Morella rubra TaxID=262757 RepID=A0A6A1WVE9_9ROSI|nr:hypothetical protein CJ030_MR1G008461 [Morella rubra]